MILISVWEGTEARPEVERFCELWGIEGTILLDESGEYARQLGVRGVPTNVVVDERGTVRGFGLVRLDELDAAVERLLS